MPSVVLMSDLLYPSLIVTSRLAFDSTAPSKLSAKTRTITRIQRLFPLPILPWHIGLVLRFISIKDTWKIWNDYWGMGYIPVFTVWKYLVGGIYQRGDLKLKSVKISVQGPFKVWTSGLIMLNSYLYRKAYCSFELLPPSLWLISSFITTFWSLKQIDGS